MKYKEGNRVKKIFRNISVLILASLLSSISCRADSNFKYLPQKLGDLSLARVIQGKAAAAIINKMHGETLDECKNYIAYYGSHNSKNILYISVYESAENAKANLMNMAMKLAGGSSVFSPLTYSGMGHNVHFETEGMGLKHYFYRTENILFWWQVEPDKAKATYKDLLEFDFSGLNKK
ncbi:MAG: hypothetical protein WBY47_09615 [Desulfobacterales bacterium]|jgi:hypothetical protein